MITAARDGMYHLKLMVVLWPAAGDRLLRAALKQMHNIS